MIRDVKALVDYFVKIFFSHTFREVNFLTDVIASVGHVIVFLRQSIG